jgi:hypothetical protein
MGDGDEWPRAGEEAEPAEEGEPEHRGEAGGDLRASGSAKLEERAQEAAQADAGEEIRKWGGRRR